MKTALPIFKRISNISLKYGSRSYSAISVGQHYDVVISGGGMIGFAMACSLGKNSHLSDKKILLVESSSPAVFKKDPYNLRVCALNPGSKSLLEAVGAWQHIEQLRYGSVKKMQVWDACSDAAITFGKPDLSEDVAYIVENDLVLDSLTREAKKLTDQVDIIYQTKVVQYNLPTRENSLAQVVLDNGSTISTDLIIGADGFNSGLRKAMNSQYISYDYAKMGVVATVEISETESNVTAWQRFLPSGPIALLPLNNQLSSLVWSTDKESAKCLLDLPTDEFVDRVNQALWNDEHQNLLAQDVSERVAEMVRVLNVNSSEDGNHFRQLPPSIVGVVGRRGAFPLALGHAVDYISEKAALIGDAAHRVHPMAGQGANLGFGDVATLTDVIVQAVANGADIGSTVYLDEYQSSRLQHNIPVMASIHGLHFLYNTTWTPFVLLRSVGFNLLDALPSIKQLISRRANI